MHKFLLAGACLGFIGTLICTVGHAAPMTAPQSTATQQAANSATSATPGPATATTATSLPPIVAKKIVIDPGHGGHDIGASASGARESEIALAISKMLSQLLLKNGYKVQLTRSRDEFLSLEKRAAIANESNADLFLSIHLNSSTDARAQGKEFYFQNQLAVDEESLFLANRENHAHEDPSAPSVNPGQDRVQKAGLRAAETARLPKLEISNTAIRTDVRGILEDLDRTARIRYSSELAKALFHEWHKSDVLSRGPASRGIHQAPFFLVSNVAMPSVLVEVGFLSHAKEGARLQQAAYQEALATALANGINRYFKR